MKVIEGKPREEKGFRAGQVVQYKYWSLYYPEESKWRDS